MVSPYRNGVREGGSAKINLWNLSTESGSDSTTGYILRRRFKAPFLKAEQVRANERTSETLVSSLQTKRRTSKLSRGCPRMSSGSFDSIPATKCCKLTEDGPQSANQDASEGDPPCASCETALWSRLPSGQNWKGREASRSRVALWGIYGGLVRKQRLVWPPSRRGGVEGEVRGRELEIGTDAVTRPHAQSHRHKDVPKYLCSYAESARKTMYLLQS